MNEYKVKFEFTTVKGSLFSGRTGECFINTTKSIDEIDYEDEELISLCANVVYHLKPNWKIFMLKIIEVSTLTPLASPVSDKK